MIISKRHPFFFYGFLFLITFLFGGIASFLLLKIDRAFFDSIICFLVVIWFWISLIINTPRILLDNEYIKFGKKSYKIDDVIEVNLTGKQHFRYLFFTYMEATSLIFKDGTKKVIFDNMYSNSAEMKLFLKQVVIDKQTYKPYQLASINKNVLQFENEKQFKGSPFFSFRGIILWSFIILVIYALFFSKSPNIPRVLFEIIGLSWFVFNSWQMYYFSLTKNYLIVKNHFFFWVTDIYKLSDIHEIIYETFPSNPNCMRIITKDFNNKLYRAGTLNDKTWIELMHNLHERGIEVRNECIPET